MKNIECSIIDRTEEERHRDFEEAFAEGIGVSIGELREGVKEITDHEEKVKAGEYDEMVISWGHTALAGKIMLGGSWRKLIK